ncbi:P-loop containing nucleoside triphosphate hydrolase protein [Protomyces lactucae-debilis]|uniref:RNA helicase n=1 Tax=Protomyces lactucae-debilis TaxID=2754530 RepID=A0A1Y2FHD8_PROLT|nr:P-loop containing nucleoside triphosphate hydrolase protein [Protomyces lactucae-debilis]ORY82676.1 P-loop containing nucleoside triphosphate hydrolase protein [Protomyces lactucae-debilis]
MFSILSGGTNLAKQVKVLETSTRDHENALKRKRDAITSLEPISTPEACTVLRRQLRISVTGEPADDPIFPITHFKAALPAFLLPNFETLGIESPTPIQMQAMAVMLRKFDLFACAPTGSGKTLAFALPILASLKRHKEDGYRAVVLSPTRELATQIHEQFKQLTPKTGIKCNLLTKSNATIQGTKEPGLARHYDILITTPQRLVNAIKEDKIDLSKVRQLVLDEADRLFEENFVEQTDEILAACTSSKLRKALFSATLPSGVEQLAKSVMSRPIRVIVGKKDTATDLIEQQLKYVGTEQGKLMECRSLAKSGALKPPVLIFVQSIDRAKQLYEELDQEGLNVDVIHSDRPQVQRDGVITNFREGRTWILIATELLSRGIDFEGVELVINYDFPQSVQSYIHRIGRTGRAGHRGKAITFFAKEDGPFLKSVASVIRASGGEVPDWMLDLKKPSKKEKKALRKKPVERKNISTTSRYEKEKEAHKKQMIRQSLVAKNRKEKEVQSA